MRYRAIKPELIRTTILYIPFFTPNVMDIKLDQLKLSG